MRDLTIYTDGSVYPNPNGIGGWAYVAPDFNGPGEDYVYKGWHPRTTNNRMELTAALSALGIVERGSFVTIVTDSQYVQRCFARRCWPESKPNADLGRMLLESKRDRFIEVRFVPGHSGDKYNDKAHELANEARLEGIEYEKRRKALEKNGPSIDQGFHAVRESVSRSNREMWSSYTFLDAAPAAYTPPPATPFWRTVASERNAGRVYSNTEGTYANTAGTYANAPTSTTSNSDIEMAIEF